MKILFFVFLAIWIPAFEAGAAAECPARPQRVVIFDFRSGWWQGDGAGTYDDVYRAITAACPDVSLEYSHRIFHGDLDFDPMDFPSRPFSEYDQIWVLSGSRNDNMDLPIEGREFRRYLSGILTSGKNVFLGSGLEYTTHSIAVATALDAFDAAPSMRKTVFELELERIWEMTDDPNLVELTEYLLLQLRELESAAP